MPFLAADISVPWIIVAMIFISFLRFLLERIKGTGPAEEDLDQPPWSRQPDGAPSAPPDHPRPPSASEELRRFLETLREEPQPAPPPPTARPVAPVAQRAAPPPPPAAAVPPEPPVQTVTADQKAAAHAYRKRFKFPTPSESRLLAAPRRSLASWLRDPDSLRHAVVLREVLGPPIALRPRDQDLH